MKHDRVAGLRDFGAASDDIKTKMLFTLYLDYKD